jgi:hypothetical protein
MHPKAVSRRSGSPRGAQGPLGAGLVASLALALAGCTGSIDAGPGNGPSGARPNDPARDPQGAGGQPPATAAPAGVSAGAAPLRRLNAVQYRNTVQDLLGLGELVAEGALPPDDAIGDERFVSNVHRPVQGSDLDRYADLAESIARRATQDLPALLACDPSGGNEAACLDGFIESFGKRAFRRPLTSLEVDRARTLVAAGRADGGLASGVRLLVQGLLQSASFLYLVEPAPAAEAGKVVALDDWALASRLSYFFLNSMPDSELFAAAEGGRLAKVDEVAAQASRLMGTQRFRDTVANFHQQWLETGELRSAEKDVQLFPAWNEALRTAMLEEPRRFVEFVMKDGDGKLATLLHARYSVLSGPLYELYGVPRPAGASATAWQKADLDPEQRSGLITQAGIMASLASEDRTSFIRRGKLIRAGLLCTPVPDPPPGVDASETDVPATADARARAAVHRDKPECASCHALFDPLGFAFENFDAIGRYRTTENGKPVDARTEIIATETLNGPVRDAIDMIDKLAAAPEVQRCVATQWLRFALGRDDSVDDAASLTAALQGFRASEGKVTDLLLGLARSDSFRYQKVKP